MSCFVSPRDRRRFILCLGVLAHGRKRFLVGLKPSPLAAGIFCFAQSTYPLPEALVFSFAYNFPLWPQALVSSGPFGLGRPLGVTLSLVIAVSHDSVMVPVARPSSEYFKNREKRRPLDRVGVTVSSVIVLLDDSVIRHRLVE